MKIIFPSAKSDVQRQFLLTFGCQYVKEYLNKTLSFDRMKNILSLDELYLILNIR
jgi:hypothetical protein